MSKRYFITGIGTDVGKTLVSTILVEKLQADYWKPVQCGDLEHTDTDKVRALVSNERSHFHPESYRLKEPASPHKAAALEGLTIDPSKIQTPASANTLIIEGAGGLMVPLNEDCLFIDIIPSFQAEIILVANIYLGSINHTLLSIEALKTRHLSIKGILFNGDKDPYTEELILHRANTTLIGRIPKLTTIDKKLIQAIGKEMTL